MFKAMKRFNQNQIHKNNVTEKVIRPSFFSKSANRKNAGIVAAIFAVIVLHSAIQFGFFRSEEVSLKAEAFSGQTAEIKFEREQSVEVKTETEIAMKKPEIVKMPEIAAPIVQPEPKIVRSRVVIKKKEPRLSEAQRLRRAERILTGV
jgi:hypothetical protein